MPVNYGPQLSGTVFPAAAAGSGVTLAASNPQRKGVFIFNNSTAVMFVKLGTTGSSADHSFQIASLGSKELVPPYTQSPLWAIWGAATGSAMVTEAF